MLIKKLLMKMWQWGKTYRFVSTIANALPKSVLWSLNAITESDARSSGVPSGSVDDFEQAGIEFADKFREVAEPGLVVLDFGCGIGRVEKYLAQYCREIHGVDVSPLRIRLAKRRHKGLENVYFHRNNGRDLSIFPDSTFDFIFSEQVLHHNEKEGAIFLMLEMLRTLKPQGKVYLHFPNLLAPRFLKAFIERSSGKYYQSPNRIRYWLPDEVQTISKAIGFDIITLDVVNEHQDESSKPSRNIWVLASKRVV